MGKGKIIWLLNISSESISVPRGRRRLCLIYKEISSQQQAFSIETAEALLKAFNMRKEFGFNLDPVIFVKRLSSHIYSVHAKDGELVKEN